LLNVSLIYVKRSKVSRSVEGSIGLSTPGSNVPEEHDGVDGSVLESDDVGTVEDQEEVTLHHSWPGEQVDLGVDALWLFEVDVGDEVVVALHTGKVGEGTVDQSAQGAQGHQHGVAPQHGVVTRSREGIEPNMVHVLVVEDGVVSGSEGHRSLSMSHWSDVVSVLIFSVEEGIGEELDCGVCHILMDEKINKN